MRYSEREDKLSIDKTFPHRATAGGTAGTCNIA